MQLIILITWETITSCDCYDESLFFSVNTHDKPLIKCIADEIPHLINVQVKRTSV